MGSSTQTSTEQQHSVTQPWAPAVPGLQQAVTDATSLYSKGIGTGVWSGPRVAQLGDDALTGLQSIRDQSAADNAGALGTSYLQGVLGANGGVSYGGPSLNGDGLSSGTMGALSNLSGVKGVDLSGLKSLSTSLADPNSGVNRTASDFMSGARDITTIPQLDQLFAKSQAPSAAETNLSGIAAGDSLDPTKNAIFQNLVKTSSDNALQAQKEAFAASGRYGSGAFAGATTKAVNDTQSQLYASQYNTEAQRQLAATSQIDAARQAASQLGLGITNAKTGVESTNNQQRLAGAGVAQAQTAQQAGVLGQILGGDQFNSNLDYQKAVQALGTYRQGTSDAMSNEQNRVSTALQSQGQGLQAAGMLPSLDALRYTPAQQQLAVGSVLQGQDQSNIDAAMQAYQEQQDMPWSNLNRYAGLMGGIGGLGGTTDSYGQTKTKTSQSPLQTLLGGALGIGGLVSKFVGK